MVSRLVLEKIDENEVTGWTDQETISELRYFGHIISDPEKGGRFYLFVDGRFDFSAVLDYLRETYQAKMPDPPGQTDEFPSRVGFYWFYGQVSDYSCRHLLLAEVIYNQGELEARTTGHFHLCPTNCLGTWIRIEVPEILDRLL